MISTSLPTILLSASAAAAMALVSASPPTALSRRACGERATKICFGGSQGGTPQNIDVEDLEYVAAYLRNAGRKAAGGTGAFYTMPSGLDCEEWAIDVPGAGTVLALAKHINPRTLSSVLLTDMADTIDGGGNSTGRADSLVGCGTAGGWPG